MPITPHYACKELPGDTVICRFMEMWKFRDLFANEELYFTRTDLFKDDDPWEALPSDEYARHALGLRKFVLEDELKLNNDQAFNRQYSESCYITCWQIFEGETVHMWGRYGKGVAILSRFDRLKAQLSPMLDPVLLGTVKYSEADTKGYNLIQFLFTKRAAYEKEKELRIVLQCHDPVAGMNRHFNEDNFPGREPLDDLNPLHKWVHPYKRRRIDLKSLVTGIRLSPWGTEDEFAEVNTWIRNKNFSCPVTPSDLTSPLTPTFEELSEPSKSANRPRV
jgi:hypothetical protein